jgi:hypothetical protein
MQRAVHQRRHQRQFHLEHGQQSVECRGNDGCERPPEDERPLASPAIRALQALCFGTKKGGGLAAVKGPGLD